jgi:ABC-type multidrug transport system ATPase subunit
VRVEARHVTRHFGKLVALSDVSFTLPEGRRMALVGPNGSGKSTLNRAVLGLLTCEGEILLDDRPIARRPESARRIAYVPQIAPQLAAPVGELLRAVVRLRGIETDVLEKLCRELGLDVALLGRRPFRSLSGGMKQKLMIALALASHASLLVLDEPTGSLDASSRDRFFQLMERLDRRTSVMLCSHRLEEVRQIVDEVLLLEEGRLRHQGPVAAFLASATTSLVEVRVEDEAAAGWLEARGFHATGRGWWSRTLAQPEKRRLVAEISAGHGPRLLDLSVRDLESLELGSGREGSA